MRFLKILKARNMVQKLKEVLRNLLKKDIPTKQKECTKNKSTSRCTTCQNTVLKEPALTKVADPKTKEIIEKLKDLGMADFEILAAFDYMVEHAPIYDPNKPIGEQLKMPDWFWRRVEELKAKKYG